MLITPGTGSESKKNGVLEANKSLISRFPVNEFRRKVINVLLKKSLKNANYPCFTHPVKKKAALKTAFFRLSILFITSQSQSSLAQLSNFQR